MKFANSKYAIRLPDVNLHDSGVYTCIVANDYGLLNWTFKLDVIGNCKYLLVNLFCELWAYISVLFA